MVLGKTFWGIGMINEEITIDVRGFSREKKKRVQDAFFKLGICWPFRMGYEELDKCMYTNTCASGNISAYLMYSESQQNRTPTHSYEQLMEIAGMSDKGEFTKNDLKDGMIVRYRGKKYIVFGAFLHAVDAFASVAKMNFNDVQKVETLEGDVLYERERFIELADGQTLSVKELKRMAAGNYSDSIPKMAKYILDAEGL